MTETGNPGKTASNQTTPSLDQRRELNNVLARLAGQGNSAALAQLWEVNRPVIRRMFWQWYDRNRSIADAAGITMEDFEQEGFFAVKRAAEYHDPEKGAFLTSLHYFVMHQIREATCKGGVRCVDTKDGRKVRVSAEPLDGAQSLDEPIPWDDAGELTRADIMPDPTAAQAFDEIEQACYRQELREVLDKALDLLPESQKGTITRRFYEGITIKKAAEIGGITTDRVRQLEAMALRSLRKNHELRRFCGEELEARAYQGTGLDAWKNSGSVQERFVEWIEEKE